MITPIQLLPVPIEWRKNNGWLASLALRTTFEESDETLDYSEPDPVEFWEAKQRELIVSVVDYNLSTLSDLVGEKTIDISPKYQRRFR